MQVSRTQLETITGCTLRFKNKPGDLILATASYDLDDGDNQLKADGSKYEWFQIFDQNDDPYTIDDNVVILYRGECHGHDRIRGVFHRGTDVWVVDNDDRLLVPIRSKLKDLYPGKGDNSVGEHNKVGETYMETAVRGFSEELFTYVGADELALILKLPMREEDQWQMSQYYVYRDTKGIVFGSKEISKLNWIPIHQLVGKNLAEDFNFRPDHVRALEAFVFQYVSGNCPV